MTVNGKSLCLACSSSLPPSKSEISSLFTTNCCQRPICPSCITSNPRLARYDPCLACLAGVSLLASKSASARTAPSTPLSPPIVNLSGEVRDQDTFVLGDDDEDDDPRAEIQISSPIVQHQATDALEFTQTDLPSEEEVTAMPTKYYLNRSDTLQGLSLRLGVDILEICKLNNLPPNIIRNPNLLHTRAFLILPPTSKSHPPLIKSESKDQGREAKLVREQAAKRIQTLTKEVDWRIAHAYVALADDEHDQETVASKLKEVSGATHTAFFASTATLPNARLESLAIERYLDDLDWEAEEIKAGRQPSPPKFPFGDFRSKNGHCKPQRGSGWSNA